jgi:flagellar biosynthesis protein FlhF
MNDHMPPSPVSVQSRVVAFVGPTGVGKTTTIAKIAAVELLKNKRKVGLITADTFRIAAVEQLKTYANILQIPVEVVFSTEEVAEAIDKLKDRDLILIDTAGRNYGDTVFVEKLNEFLKASQPDETCLVLSLTTKSADLEHIVANFEGVEIDKFIFTKLDETSSYGALYNLAHRFRKPLAYLTTGQNVPDDIEVATPERIAKLVVGEKQYV